jgi:hypothetical protein
MLHNACTPIRVTGRSSGNESVKSHIDKFAPTRMPISTILLSGIFSKRHHASTFSMLFEIPFALKVEMGAVQFNWYPCEVSLGYGLTQHKLGYYSCLRRYFGPIEERQPKDFV